MLCINYINACFRKVIKEIYTFRCQANNLCTRYYFEVVGRVKFNFSLK